MRQHGRIDGKSVVLVLALLLLVLSPGLAQVRVGESISFPGVIEKVSEDLRFIVVNEVKISLFPGTRVLDDNGKELKPVELKPKLRIQLEVLSTTQGFLAQKIVVKRKP